MNHIACVAKVQLVDWRARVGWVWGILGSSFAVNLLIRGAQSSTDRQDFITGGILSIYIMMTIMSTLAVTQVLPLALGFSATRRAFYAALSLRIAAESLLFGAGLYMLSLIEEATGGWGVDLHFFGLPLMHATNGALQVLVFAGPLCLMAYLGVVCGTVMLRWGSTGIFVALLVTVMLVGLIAAVITWAGSWTALGHWFANQSVELLFIGLAMVATLVLAAAGYGFIRRTVA